MLAASGGDCMQDQLPCAWHNSHADPNHSKPTALNCLTTLHVDNTPNSYFHAERHEGRGDRV